MDPSRERSSLLVVHAAGIPGPHMAVQIQPLDGGNTVDYSVFQFYVPPEGLMNGKSLHGFVSHRDQQVNGEVELPSLSSNHVTNLGRFQNQLGNLALRRRHH